MPVARAGNAARGAVRSRLRRLGALAHAHLGARAGDAYAHPAELRHGEDYVVLYGVRVPGRPEGAAFDAAVGEGAEDFPFRHALAARDLYVPDEERARREQGEA